MDGDKEVTGVVERLLAMRFEERVANPCIGAERADLVLAGCAIFEAIRRASRAERLRVADRGLREGMLVQMMRADGVWGDRRGARRERIRRDETRPPRAEDRVKTGKSRTRRRSSGSSASSTIPMWRAPSAKAIARAPPTS